MRLALFAQPQRAIAHPAGRFEVRRVLREGEGHPLVIADRLTERMPLCRVDGGFVQARLGGAEAQQSECGAAEVEVTHHRAKSPARLADQMRARDEDLVEMDRTPAERQAAHAGHVVHSDRVLIERYEITADAGRTLRTGSRA